MPESQVQKQVEERPERKYALTKVKAGDYVFPANDLQVVWRIVRYEDGPSHGIDDWPKDREVWGLWKWIGPVGAGSVVELENWDRWTLVASTLDTRQAAIDHALKGASDA
jgi:hypothetical protein